MSGIRAAKMAKALNIFPVSLGSMHWLNKALTRLYLQNPSI